jgi:hypothetical protein
MKTEFAMLSYNLGALVSERDVGEKIEKTDVSMEDLPVVMRLVSWFFSRKAGETEERVAYQRTTLKM